MCCWWWVIIFGKKKRGGPLTCIIWRCLRWLRASSLKQHQEPFQQLGAVFCFLICMHHAFKSTLMQYWCFSFFWRGMPSREELGSILSQGFGLLPKSAPYNGRTVTPCGLYQIIQMKHDVRLKQHLNISAQLSWKDIETALWNKAQSSLFLALCEKKKKTLLCLVSN